MIYRKKWHKRWPQSLLSYIRDCCIYLCPIKLPEYFRKLIFGFDPKFVFLVHPRRKEDIFIALPFLRPLCSLLPKKIRYQVIQAIPSFVLGRIHTINGVSGLVITTTKLPEYLMDHRRESLREAHRCIKFASRISASGSYFGLGGWWPMITRRGLAIDKYALKYGLILTNGHTGTLCSIAMMIKKVAEVCEIPMDKMNILVLGVGKMGSNVVKALYGTVKHILIYDSNQIKIIRMEEEIRNSLLNGQNSVVTPLPYGSQSLHGALAYCHLCICTTSNVHRILKPNEIPNNVLIIDDSRPEAFSRVVDRDKKIAVLEGGLLKILGCETNYDFGFGRTGNVFGCLAEVYLLASDRGKELSPTLGDISILNYKKMLSLLQKYNVVEGEFRSSNLKVSQDIIRDIVTPKSSSLKDSMSEVYQ